MLNRKGQSIIEYTVIIVIILGVMIAMKDYVKRGVQGRWKSAADGLGDQYDPQAINSSVNYATQVNAQTIVQVVAGTGPNSAIGQWTTRDDSSNDIETKTGSTQVGN
jgi:Flp pilus assembly pilin Flp